MYVNPPPDNRKMEIINTLILCKAWPGRATGTASSHNKYLDNIHVVQPRPARPCGARSAPGFFAVLGTNLGAKYLEILRKSMLRHAESASNLLFSWLWVCCAVMPTATAGLDNKYLDNLQGLGAVESRKATVPTASHYPIIRGGRVTIRGFRDEQLHDASDPHQRMPQGPSNRQSSV